MENKYFANNDEIEVHRRREGSSQGPSGRAEAPQRRGSEGSGGGGGGGMGSGGGGGTGGGTGGFRLPWWAIILLLIAYGVYSLISGNGSGSQTAEPTLIPVDTAYVQEEQPTSLPAEPTLTPAPRKTPAMASSTQGQTWTVMLYQDADDKVLEEDILFDLNEAERAGSTDRVNIVSQVDRYPGAYAGDGNWTDARRFYITKDNDLTQVHSKMVQDLGEVDMANGKTLVNFAVWAAQTYPADKYILILSDHGMGWPGGWTDGSTTAKDTSSGAPLASALDDSLYLNELDQSLSQIQQQAGISAFEVIGMDACLMGHLEVFSALQPYARYAVASQETEPGLGWAYSSFLSKLVANPDMDGAELSREIVNSYVKDDQRIVDDQARASFLRQGSPLGGLYRPSQVSASQLAQQIGHDITLTAVDLSALPELNQAVNDLAVALQSEDQSRVAEARDYAQSFTNIFGNSTPGPYIDLGNFIQVLKKNGMSAKSGQAADRVLAAIPQLVLAERHGAGKPGAEGVSIYFPNSSLYRSPVAGPQSYTVIAGRFARESLWDDFLAFHYNDIPINPNQKVGVIPGASAAGRAPGAGTIEVSPITLSAKTAAPNQPVKMSAQIKGTNIGYIYLFVGYYDQASNSIFIADTDYLESPDTREVNGVYYPQWKENQAFTMSLQWNPTVFEIDDGKTAAVALFNPQEYGATAQDAVYTVDGVYTFADSGDQRNARLYFRDGELRQVFVFTGSNQASAPREVTPQAGDTFTIQEKWLDLDSTGKVSQRATQDGVTLTFGDQMFKMKEVYAAAGNYVVGFNVADLDGNANEVYTQVVVK